MNGVVNIYKEAGFTSHDVVAKLRGILGMKKIGHTGTLDPDAVGVLPVCLGKATKICDMITDWDKTYEAVMLLGTVTDTLDISGQVISQNEVNVTTVEIIDVIDSFVGEIQQVPPMYSALKQNGKKLYELARQGIEVERKSRTVNIKSIHINDIDLEDNTVTFTVECSKGTYIRSLCDDIGKKLGCGACMKKLTRKRVGVFGIDESITLEQIEKLRDEGILNSYINRIDDLFSENLSVNVSSEYDKLLYNGNKLPLEVVDTDNTNLNNEISADSLKYNVYDKDNRFIGVYEIKDDMLVPIKIFMD